MVNPIRRAALAGVALGAGAALGGCSTASPGGASLAALSTPAVAAPAVARPARVAALAAPVPAPVEASPLEGAPMAVPVNYGEFLGGPIGAKLPDADRTAALAAEDGALASGERRTWKGAKGVFGYVVPGPNAAAATAVSGDGAPAQCRSFTATVFFAGRPQIGHGTGCRDLDGNWHVTS